VKNKIPLNIRNNLRFLVIEVSTQLASLERYFIEPTPHHAAAVISRSGYAMNLTQRIHADSYQYIACHKEKKTATLLFTALSTIAGSLEQVSQLCGDCIQHACTITHHACLQASHYTDLLEQVSYAIRLIEPAIFTNNTQLALKIGSVEQQLKTTCDGLIANYVVALKNKVFIEDLIAALFVARSVEHIGDALLNISEALISGSLGQTVNIDRYHALHDFISHLKKKDNQDWGLKTLAHTRSGSTISALRKKHRRQNTILAVFKDGTKRKLQDEQESVKTWHQLYPGIAPRILSYNSRAESAALLIEHLQGVTFENVLLHQSVKLQRAALAQLCITLKSVWQTTRREKKVCAHFMGQLQTRLTEIYHLHPQFKQPTQQIGHLNVPAFESLLKQAQHNEAQLKPHFSVYIHGDFNSDNIIYNPAQHKINFIDLHRSGYMDYVQDVSVFMISNYRLQVLDKSLKQNVLGLTLDFYHFAAQFAKQNHDSSFELRLALGLARSFATSTRFILDKSLANAMFFRARYLIEQVLSIMNSEQRITYRVPIAEIFVG